MAFDRKTELYIGVFKDDAFTHFVERSTGNRLYSNDDVSDQTGYLVDGLYYTFEVTQSTEYWKNSATFTIFNPNDETIQQIMTAGCSVILRAGYSDEDMGTIFVGQVAMAYPEDDDPETTKLVIVCKSQRGANFPLQRTYISAVVDKGKTYYDVVKLIADYVSIPLTCAEPLKKHVLEAPYIINSNVRQALEDFKRRKIRKLGATLIISNSELVYFDLKKPYFSAVYLNYNTGLISATQVRDETYQSSEDAFNENAEYYIGIKKTLKDFDLTDEQELEQYRKLTCKENVKPKNEVDFKCIMNPALHVLTPVYIDARRREGDQFAVVGEFQVKELHFTGGNYAGSDYSVQGRAFENTIGEDSGTSQDEDELE
ncbi:MAG: hypothetical protein IKS96_07295 [Fibrobacter sp.]|nr:hypothetical protein [Fibrobacter sp.]MBR6449733.1 hypothetical protein [Fibrobacter sp.]